MPGNNQRQPNIVLHTLHTVKCPKNHISIKRVDVENFILREVL